MAKLSAFTDAMIDAAVAECDSEIFAEASKAVKASARSGAPIEGKQVRGATRVDVGFNYMPDTPIDLISSSAWKSGTNAELALCISKDRSVARGQVQAESIIVITHLAIEGTVGLTDAALLVALKEGTISLSAPGSVDVKEVLVLEPLKDWFMPGAKQASVGYDSTASTLTGRHVTDVVQVGRWEEGLRLLPRPITVVEGQAAALFFNFKSGSVPGGAYTLPIVPRFRFNRYRGISGK